VYTPRVVGRKDEPGAGRAPDALKGALAVALAGTLWGTWKIWLRGPALDASAQGAFALGLAGVIATGLALARRDWRDVPRWAWAVMVLFGITEAGNSGLYFRAISEGDLATAVVTHYLAPVFVAIASPFLREPMGRRAPVSAAVACLATAGLVGFGHTSAGSHAAAMEGAGSAVFYAAGIFLSRRITPYFGPWALVGFHDLVAAPLIWAGSRTPYSAAGSDEIVLLVIGALVSGTIAAGLYFYGLARIPAARTAVLCYLEPVSAAVVGAVLLREAVTPAKIAAMLVILGAGVAVATDAAQERAR
jgi:drug/metabolite transporter (DMT)-like permease